MFSLALKNILFYKGRSITTFVLTFLSTILFVVYVSMMDGSHKSMLENTLKIYTGAIEIYHKDYRDIGGNEYLIQDVKTITDKLLHVEGIEAFTARYETYGLLSSAENSAASMVAGIEPDKEKAISSISLALKEGAFLSDDSGSCLYMGEGLVQKLKLKLGGEVAFVGGASDNSFAADIFKVCGIFKTGSFEFDLSTSFVSRSYFDKLMLSQNKASYITVKVDNLEHVDTINKKIVQTLDSEKLESLTWKTLMKTMVEAMEVDSIFGYISLSLFLIVIFFVIMIYGFINVSSRIKEFGVLRCIGLCNRDVFSLLFYEIFILSTLAVFLAAPIAGTICYYYSQHPIVIEGIADMYKDYGIVSDEIPFNFDIFTITWNLAVIYGLNFLSILYPYVYINSFRPIEATKHV
ncbi:ABC-type transport system, involved in lipoprotein release, permease component [Epsilonproteobacteria bacterium SCGC AD-311-C15]|nr:ABC-type transport system, involved in lipoprotein release, permease component [Epsilonproteobacteria bacterium SCGC AD-311-C15]